MYFFWSKATDFSYKSSPVIPIVFEVLGFSFLNSVFESIWPPDKGQFKGRDARAEKTELRNENPKTSNTIGISLLLKAVFRKIVRIREKKGFSSMISLNFCENCLVSILKICYRLGAKGVMFMPKIQVREGDHFGVCPSSF